MDSPAHTPSATHNHAADLELATLLRGELETLRALDSAIAAEYAALTDNSVEHLEDVTRTKIDAVDTHRSQQDIRLQWMQAKGFARDLGLAELVAQTGASVAGKQLQTELSELAAQCQENNRRNGGLIVRLHERAQGALEVIRGDSATSDVYSLSGAKEHVDHGRVLGKA